MTPEEDAMVAKLLASHQHSLNILSAICNDYACLIEQGLPRCCRLKCTEAATVKHPTLGIEMCDACAAVTVTRAGKNISSDPLNDLNLFRAMVANDDLWNDLPNADRIRRLAGYVFMLKRDDEPVPPEDPNELQ